MSSASDDKTNQKYWHYSVTCGENPRPDGAINRACLVTIHQASSEEDAISQAKEKIDRPYYTVSQIYECHECEKKISDEAYKLTALKMMKEAHG